MHRLILVLMLSLIACTPSPTGDPLATGSPTIPVFYAEDGGIASVNETYTVNDDGSVIVTERQRPATRTLPNGAAAVSDLLARVRATGVTAIPTTQGNPIVGCCDRKRYEIRFVLDNRQYRYVIVDGDPAAKEVLAARDLIKASVRSAS